jgi:hypothetical protein
MEPAVTTIVAVAGMRRAPVGIRKLLEERRAKG